MKILHSSIAKDLMKRLGKPFGVKSQGLDDNDKEGTIIGRYYPKKIDITIYHKDKPVAGFGVKFVVRNYSQNSNNYFENMLGETANIRANKVPYFQIFILFDKFPYFKKNNTFDKYQLLTEDNLKKYFILSKDKSSEFFHTPNITLIALLSLKEKTKGSQFKNLEDYLNYYKRKSKLYDLITYSNKIKDSFGDAVELNRYNSFIKRAVHYIKGNTKI